MALWQKIFLVLTWSYHWLTKHDCNHKAFEYESSRWFKSLSEWGHQFFSGIAMPISFLHSQVPQKSYWLGKKVIVLLSVVWSNNFLCANFHQIVPCSTMLENFAWRAQCLWPTRTTGNVPCSGLWHYASLHFVFRTLCFSLSAGMCPLFSLTHSPFVWKTLPI